MTGGGGGRAICSIQTGKGWRGELSYSQQNISTKRGGGGVEETKKKTNILCFARALEETEKRERNSSIAVDMGEPFELLPAMLALGKASNTAQMRFIRGFASADGGTPHLRLSMCTRGREWVRHAVEGSLRATKC